MSFSKVEAYRLYNVCRCVLASTAAAAASVLGGGGWLAVVGCGWVLAKVFRIVRAELVCLVCTVGRSTQAHRYIIFLVAFVNAVRAVAMMMARCGGGFGIDDGA